MSSSPARRFPLGWQDTYAQISRDAPRVRKTTRKQVRAAFRPSDVTEAEPRTFNDGLNVFAAGRAQPRWKWRTARVGPQEMDVADFIVVPAAYITLDPTGERNTMSLGVAQSLELRGTPVSVDHIILDGYPLIVGVVLDSHMNNGSLVAEVGIFPEYRDTVRKWTDSRNLCGVSLTDSIRNEGLPSQDMRVVELSLVEIPRRDGAVQTSQWGTAVRVVPNIASASTPESSQRARTVYMGFNHPRPSPADRDPSGGTLLCGDDASVVQILTAESARAATAPLVDDRFGGEIEDENAPNAASGGAVVGVSGESNIGTAVAHEASAETEAENEAFISPGVRASPVPHRQPHFSGPSSTMSDQSTPALEQATPVPDQAVETPGHAAPMELASPNASPLSEVHALTPTGIGSSGAGETMGDTPAAGASSGSTPLPTMRSSLTRDMQSAGILANRRSAAESSTGSEQSTGSAVNAPPLNPEVEAIVLNAAEKQVAELIEQVTGGAALLASLTTTEATEARIRSQFPTLSDEDVQHRVRDYHRDYPDIAEMDKAFDDLDIEISKKRGKVDAVSYSRSLGELAKRVQDKTERIQRALAIQGQRERAEADISRRAEAAAEAAVSAARAKWESEHAEKAKDAQATAAAAAAATAPARRAALVAEGASSASQGGASYQVNSGWAGPSLRERLAARQGGTQPLESSIASASTPVPAATVLPASGVPVQAAASVGIPPPASSPNRGVDVAKLGNIRAGGMAKDFPSMTKALFHTLVAGDPERVMDLLSKRQDPLPGFPRTTVAGAPERPPPDVRADYTIFSLPSDLTYMHSDRRGKDLHPFAEALIRESVLFGVHSPITGSAPRPGGF